MYRIQYNWEMSVQTNSSFGEKIRFCRQKRGLNQTEAAKMMGVQRTSLNRWEKGRERCPEAKI